MDNQRLLSVRLGLLRLPKELSDIIFSFLCWDVRSISYANWRKEQKEGVLRQIRLSLSRKKGFNGYDESDSEDPHWAFSSLDEEVCLQAINCPRCGGYQFSNTIYNSFWEVFVGSRVMCGCVGLDFYQEMMV